MKARNNCAAGLPRSWKIQGKTKIFQGQGKIFDIGKVSEKLGNSVFRFIANKSSFRFFITFFLGKTKCMLQSKETDEFDTRRLTHVVVVVSGFL